MLMINRRIHLEIDVVALVRIQDLWRDTHSSDRRNGLRNAEFGNR
jgi:hypothetical protein